MNVTITCSRCAASVQGQHDQVGGFTAGYYDVRPPNYWAQFAQTDETYLCDVCMWATPAYQRVYGRIQDVLLPEALKPLV